MDTAPKEKKCKGCETVKPLADFKISYKNRDGRANRCRACDRERAILKREAKNPEYFEHDKYYSF